MGINRVKYRLRSTESQTSVNTDTFINVQLEGNERLLPYNDINRIVDAGEVFNNERQSTTKYRIIGNFKPIMSNVLFNVSGNDSWYTFLEPSYLDDPYDNPDTGQEPLTWGQSYDQNLKEQDGWFGHYDPNIIISGSCDFNTMEPKKERFSFKPNDVNQNLKNWELTVTYPWSADTTHDLVSGNTNGGLRLIGANESIVSDRPLMMFNTPVHHNLMQGDRVRLVGLSLPIFDGDYRVVRTGLDNGDDKEYYFSVNIDYDVTINTALDTRMKRLVGGQESEYYIRLFKKVRTVNTTINNGIIENDDYELYPTAFAKTVFSDEVCQFAVNEDIEVKDLRDNLGRPLSEIFITMIKTQANFFTPIQVGLEMGNVDGIHNDDELPHLRLLHENGVIAPVDDPQQDPFISPTPLNPSAHITDDYYHGDIVEYNKFECLEYTLAMVGHRFNTNNRTEPLYETSFFPRNKAKGPRHEGYFYHPHHKMKIRDFSNYVEQGDSNTFGIPDYAENLGDGRWLWRDLLDIGLNDGQYVTLNYPFLNGAHYLYQNFCIPVRRQDPFGQYGLYYGPRFSPNNVPITFPPFDIVGSGRGNQFTVKSAEEDC